MKKYSQLIDSEIVAKIEENLLVKTRDAKKINYWRVTPDGNCKWVGGLGLDALQYEYALGNYESYLCDEESEKVRQDKLWGKSVNCF
jgi:hypothetical protein